MKSNSAKVRFRTACFSLLFVLLLFQIGNAEPDLRYGFVGTGGKAFAEKFRLSHYVLEGNQDTLTTLLSSTSIANDPAPGFQVIRRVAKLTERVDGLGLSIADFQNKISAYGQALAIWFTLPLGPKPVFNWYSPPTSALIAAESLQIVQTLRREKARMPPIPGTVWEIGNEPNLFPPLLPSEYANLFSQYYRIIKAENPSATVAFGSLFTKEVAEDLRPKMEEFLSQALIGAGLGSPGQARFDSVYANLRNTLFSRFLHWGTADYATQCFASLDPSIKPDILSLHFYPYDDRPPAQGKTEWKTKLASLTAELTSAQQSRGGQSRLWITEFGNIHATLDETAIISQTSNLLDIFESQAGLERWFYYKPTGADEQFQFFLGSERPLTRLAKDAAFAPTDGQFSCAALNSIGLLFFLRAVGQPCDDSNALSIRPRSAKQGAKAPMRKHRDWMGRTLRVMP